jgi:predicted molibdopterin-dependent oxidoreductase YjgC
MSRPAWWILGDLLTQLGEPTNMFLASEAFTALATARAEFAGMSYDSLGLKGQLMSTQPAEQGVAT